MQVFKLFHFVQILALLFATTGAHPNVNSTESSTSFWLRDAAYQSSSDSTTPGSLPMEANIVIIGGGMTGLSTLYWLQRYGFADIVLIEARGLSSGATGRNGGHLHPYFYSPSAAQLERWGREEMVRANYFEVETSLLIQDFANEHDVQDEIELVVDGSLRVFETVQQTIDGQETVQRLQTEGPNFGGIEYWDATKVSAALGTSRFLGGIYQQIGGQMFPAKLVWALARIAQDNGANIQVNTRAVLVQDSSNPAFSKEVVTERGSIHTNNVIYATNGHTLQLLPHHQDVVPIFPRRGQVIATPPIETSDFALSLIFPGDIGYLIQRIKDGRMIYGGQSDYFAGGVRATTNDIAKDPEVSRVLRDYIRGAFLVDADMEADADWTGIMGYPTDSSPLIGHLPTLNGTLSPNEYIAAGFHGHGMPQCFGAGRIIAQLMAGDIAMGDIIAPLRSDRFL